RPGLPRFKNLQPVWYWLVFLAGTLLFFDVAVRRIALSPAEVAAASGRLWGRLRGPAGDKAQVPEDFERLKSRKAQVSETIEQVAKAARRFEGGDVGGAAPPPGADVAAAARPAAAKSVQPRIAPEKQAEAADYASRLLKAKKRVWQEREEDK